MPHWTITTLALLAAAALVLFLVAAWAHLRFWTRRLTLALEYASSEQLTTPDGATIELRRIPIPKDTAGADLPPVLLVHGLGANHRNQDLHPDFSLARYLAARGRDVWLLTLRSGLRPRSWAERQRVRFEAMAENDVPVAVRGVLERTGAAALDYVGFLHGRHAALRRDRPQRPAGADPARGHRRLAGPRRRRPLDAPAPPSPAARARADDALPPRRRGLRLRLGVAAHALPLVHDQPRQRRARHHPRGDDEPDRGRPRPALRRLHRVGRLRRRDPHQPRRRAARPPARPRPGAVPRGHRRQARADPRRPPRLRRLGKDLPRVTKRFVTVGRAYGQLQDYGHGDLAIGTTVAVDLFAPIASFLEEDVAEVAADTAVAELAEVADVTAASA